MTVEPGKELLWKYVSGLCDPNEVAFVETWLNSNPEHQKELDRIRLYMSMQDSNGDSAKHEKEKMADVKEEKPYVGYFVALVLIVLVFVLLGIFRWIKN
jgi:ferric-dicitrate binding protein FerR (iron transport regulator)